MDAGELMDGLQKSRGSHPHTVFYHDNNNKTVYELLIYSHTNFSDEETQIQGQETNSPTENRLSEPLFLSTPELSYAYSWGYKIPRKVFRTRYPACRQDLS